MNYTVQLAASDSQIEFDGDQEEAHEVARNKSAWATGYASQLGYSVIAPNGRIQAVYRQGLRWKFWDQGRWVELPLFD